MQKTSKAFLIIACLLLLSGTLLGALGSHALDDVLTAKKIRSWELAVQYQLIHGLGLILLILLYEKLGQPALIKLTVWLMLAGTLMFSGTIYSTALGAPAALGMITPFGGSALMLAWLLLAIAIYRS
jgi:uncharacterized membrane protein YgdD (TMEM256/DUF423 family)